MNWPLIAYVAFGLATAELVHRNGGNWLAQTISAVGWPVYWLAFVRGLWRHLRGTIR